LKLILDVSKFSIEFSLNNSAVISENYGLKNLHQRISLFYGEGCGLTVYPNPNDRKGISIQMIVKKITCEE